MPFAVKDTEFVDDILEHIGDTIDLNIEKDEDTGKEFLELSLELPKEAYRKFGPEAAEAIKNYIKTSPHEFIHRFFPGSFDEIEWGQTEEEHMAIYENNGSLKIVLNLCCLIDS